MEFLWVTDPSILVDPRFATRLFPTETNTEAEKVNAATRLIIVFTIAAYYMLPRQYWIGGLVAIAAIFLHYNSKPETFDYVKMLEDARRQMRLGVVTAQEPTQSAVERAVEKSLDLGHLEEKARRGAEIKRQIITDELADEDTKAVGFARNAREAGNRGEIVWDEQQRIYSTRPFIRPSTDEYDSLFYPEVGPEKFLTRRT